MCIIVYVPYKMGLATSFLSLSNTNAIYSNISGILPVNASLIYLY